MDHPNWNLRDGCVVKIGGECYRFRLKGSRGNLRPVSPDWHGTVDVDLDEEPRKIDTHADGGVH